MSVIERIKRIRRDKVYVYEGENGAYYWNRRNGWNGKVTADGGQGYSFASSAKAAARKQNPGARIFVNGVEVGE